ncbi:50S ribosomal protein L6 [Gammaproteobacteria bacterium]|nr:50S ribosomal protein L6 [Gammaproteobacteria bacterium]
MSRLANVPISIPKGVTVEVSEQEVTISNGKVTQLWTVHEKVVIKKEDDSISLSVSDADRKVAFIRSMLGTDYRHLSTFIQGMCKPFETVLEIHGLGYRAKLQGNKIVLLLGKSHDDIIEPVEDVSFEVPNEREIVCRSYSKKKLGDFVAHIASMRKPDPYKAKGVRIRGRTYRTKKD